MELRDAVLARRMIRTYDPDMPVPRTELDELIRLGQRAPSAGFSQGWHYLALDDITSCNRFWDACSSGDADDWLTRMRTAPAIIVGLADKQAYLDRYAEPDKGWTDKSEAHWPVPYWYIDVGMASMIMLLAATDRGLATCFFGVPGERWEAFRTAFSVPAHLDPVGVISVGYPAPDRRSPSLKRGRRPWDEVVTYGSFA